MKKSSTIFTILTAFIALSFSATAQNIAIDGNFADWNDVPYTHQNAEGTGGRLLALKTFGDATHLYFMIEGTEAMEMGTLFMYLDTDNNAATGYNNSWQYGSGAGADYKLEGNTPWWGTLSHHSGNPDVWDDFVQVEPLTNTNVHSRSGVIESGGKKYFEFSITKSFLGTLGSVINIAIFDTTNPSTGSLPAAPFNSRPGIDSPEDIALAAVARYLQINITGTTTLPVSLASFTASSIANIVKLNWSTYSEQNNSHFEVFKSVDGLVFERITTVSGSNNSNEQRFYSFTDFNPTAGISYYELKQVDFDGKVTSLGVKDVSKNLQTSEFSLTRVSDHVVQISVYSEKPIQTQFQVANINGRIINKTPISLVAGHQKINIPLSLTPGVGVASIRTSSKLLSQKILTY
jgi:hypothetical protein